MTQSAVAAARPFQWHKSKALWICLLALFAYFAAFGSSLGQLAQAWATKEEFSHGYFIPLVSLWMLYERRAELLRHFGTGFSGLNLLLLVCAFACLVFGQLTYMGTLQNYGFTFGLLAFPLAFGGWSLTRVMLIPLIYLFFMVPVPPLLTYLMTAEMQLVSSKLGVFFIRAFGMPVFLTGNVIDLGTFKLEVVEACSGLRYLFPFLSLGFLVAYVFKGSWWQKVLLFLSTIPITIVMNSARIALTAYMSEQFGTSYAEGFSHFVEGWMVFILCIAMLLLVAWLFARLFNARGLMASLAVPTVHPPLANGLNNRTPFMVFCAAVIIGAVVASALKTPQLKIPDREELINLPFELSQWRYLGTETLSQETLEVLDADDYVVANFASEDNDLMNVYVAYLDSQESGKSWHSPRQCLPSGGWEIGQITEFALPLETRKASMTVNRALIQQGDQRILVYFWFDQRGRVITDEFAIKYYLIVDTLQKQRSDGALVRVFTTVKPDETVESAEKRLIGFAGDLVDELPAYVPL